MDNIFLSVSESCLINIIVVCDISGSEGARIHSDNSNFTVEGVRAVRETTDIVAATVPHCGGTCVTGTEGGRYCYTVNIDFVVRAINDRNNMSPYAIGEVVVTITIIHCWSRVMMELK